MAERAGWLAGTNCRQIGLALADMHGARRRVEDPLDLGCGIEFLPAIGDRIARGDVLARIHCDRRDEAEAARDRIAAALDIGEREAPARPLILDRIE